MPVTANSIITPQTPQTSNAACSAANTTYTTSPTNTVLLITAGANGARVTRVGEEVHLAFEARSFLHRQVRSMTGSLCEVGVGRWTSADLAEALAARDRQACGPVAPSSGLYLTGVAY